MTDRWVPDPLPSDGPDGRGESGRSDELETRRQTEVAASSGLFADEDVFRDDSNPVEPEVTPPAAPDRAGTSPEDPASGW